MRSYLLIAALMQFGSVAIAADTTFTCPERVRLDSGKVSDTDLPKGSKSVIATSPILLSGVSVFDGPPEEGAELMPVTTGKKATKFTWNITQPSDRPIWLACNYADQLVKVVVQAEGPKQCEATVTQSGSPRLVRAQFSCKG